MGGPLRSSRQCGIDLSVFRYQPADLLQVEAAVQSEGSDELGREEPQAEAPPSAYLVSGTSFGGVALREQYPRWGKDKLMVLLQERGWQVSTSMVGRILSYLKARGVLKEPPRNGISTRKRLWRRPYAVRKPKGYLVVEPGDLVQLDTLDVRPVPGIVLKHFTARDVVSRWDVVEAHTGTTATTAAAGAHTQATATTAAAGAHPGPRPPPQQQASWTPCKRGCPSQ